VVGLGPPPVRAAQFTRGLSVKRGRHAVAAGESVAQVGPQMVPAFWDLDRPTSRGRQFFQPVKAAGKVGAMSPSCRRSAMRQPLAVWLTPAQFWQAVMSSRFTVTQTVAVRREANR